MKKKFGFLGRIMKKNKYKGALLLSILTLIGLAGNSFAAAPSVFFSDMTDGPTSGWEGSATKGAAVSVWGTNLGATRGTSTLTVCGVTLNTDSDFVEWGKTTTPTTPRGIQRITFYLKSSMTTGPGSIRVTTSGGTSSTIPFYCRAIGTNKIYFVSRTGSDSNSGTLTTAPWLTVRKVRSSLAAGDIAYFRTGVWNEDDGNDTVLYWNDLDGHSINHANGTANKSITLASYPGEAAQLGDASRGFVIRHSWYDRLNYWTLSKFIMRSNQELTYWMAGNQYMGDDNFRIIGNDLSTYYGGTGSILTLAGGRYGETNLYVLGNWMHDAGSNTRGQIPSHRAYGFYLQGEGFHDNCEIAWNEIAYQARGRGIQLYGHTTTDYADNIKIHDNFIHHNSMTGAVLSGGDGGTGTDGTMGRNYEFTKHVYFYNNIIALNGDNVAAEGAGSIYNAVLVGGVGWGGRGGNFYLYNNTFYNNMEGELDIHGDGPLTSVSLKNNIIYGTRYVLRNDCATTPSMCSTSTNNLYFGAGGTGPSWDSNRLDNVNPLFASATPLNYTDFQLQATSPAKDAGTSILSVTRDFLGVARPNGISFDLGAFELGSIDTTVPRAPSNLRIQ